MSNDEAMLEILLRLNPNTPTRTSWLCYDIYGDEARLKRNKIPYLIYKLVSMGWNVIPVKQSGYILGRDDYAVLLRVFSSDNQENVMPEKLIKLVT